MDMKQLEYFLALVRYENISNTADLLKISQPALSKSISRLEQEIGVKLFERHGNHIKLNEHGHNFARYAAQSLEILESGLASTRQTRYNTNGEIRISCHAFPDIVSRVAMDYQFLNPTVQVNVYRHSDRTSLSNNKEDFLLCSGQESVSFLKNSENWVAQELFREKSLLLISTKYRSFPEECTSLDVAELKDNLFIGSSEKSPLYSDITFRVCAAAGFVPTVAFGTNHYLFKIRLVGEGRAIAILPECCVQTAKELYSDIRTYQIENLDTSRPIFLLRKKKTVMSEAALDFWDFALDYYGIEPDTRD